MGSWRQNVLIKKLDVTLTVNDEGWRQFQWQEPQQQQQQQQYELRKLFPNEPQNTVQKKSLKNKYMALKIDRA